MAILKGAATSVVLLGGLLQTAYATSQHARSLTHSFHHRRASVPTTLPGNWSFVGCYTDNGGARTLGAASYTDTVSMTVESCISFCSTGTNSYVYAGVEYAQECYCDNLFNNNPTNASLSDCDMTCTGNSLETCGAGDRLDIFWSGVPPPPPPATVASVGLWESLGCYTDSTGARTLPNGIGTTGAVDIESCTEACFTAGYGIAGAEYSTQCFCGSAFENGGAPAALTDCNMVCAGNSTEFCGGPNRLNIYNYTGTDLPPVTTNPGGGGGGGGGGGPTGTPVYPVTSGLPTGWEYAGCWVDNEFGRILTGYIPPANPDNTIEVCIATCAAQNFTIAGSEYSDECYCGNDMVEAATKASSDADCNMGCAGNTTEGCGGPNRLSVYSMSTNVTIYPVPTALNTSLPGDWEYQGCLAESNDANAPTVFPYELIWTNNNTVVDCLNECAAYGFPAAGLEFGDNCWCGDISDVAANSGGMAPDTDCNAPCSGDPAHLCGGSRRLQLYYWGGPNGAIDVWKTPEVTGQYEYLVPGVVVPLLTTVGVNGKVVFVEKTGTSTYPNSTGSYELDLTLVDQFDLAWRALHPKTDVFCSGSIVLPDIAARQINIGGWSLISTFGIRLYTPDGSAGVNGTNDWEENAAELSLQSGRWYPTVVLMQNSSILVMGGETGSNGPPQPTLEILPKPDGTGPTVMYLDWLDTENQQYEDLYPFLHILPSGNIFVGYWHEARILDKDSLLTIQSLPDMPSSPGSQLGGRTYPLEGASVLFPQYAPYTDPVTVLICGGGAPFGGPALDNCISIQPEVANSTWLLERMPSKRVMSCMAALPDGTFLIANGAEQGVAGFGLADFPNYNAILYDPSQPAHNRISILNTTTIARLYHSEAILLPDGRVLISGSDPEDNVHPQEMRVEVYIPPYLSNGLTQPEFNITNTDWVFEGTYTINNVKLYQGGLSTLRVSLVAAVSSTHGNSMGGRTLFPAFSCSGTSCTITAPPLSAAGNPGWHQLFILDGPTPSHSAWVRIGGDPAQLGLWPANLPDFNPPGL